MDFQFDQGVPVRPRLTGTTALLRLMKPGESKVFPSVTAVALAFRVFGRGGYRSHKEHGGTRIWRL